MMLNFLKKSRPFTKTCTGQVMAGCSPEELKKHYQYMLMCSKRNLRGFVQSKVVSGKFWVASIEGKIERDACEVCRENMKVGVIPLHAKFPSGHFYPPAGLLCRCSLGGETDKDA